MLKNKGRIKDIKLIIPTFWLSNFNFLFCLIKTNKIMKNKIKFIPIKINIIGSIIIDAKELKSLLVIIGYKVPKKRNSTKPSTIVETINNIKFVILNFFIYLLYTKINNLIKVFI